MRPELRIVAVTWDPAGVTVQYSYGDDIRVKGLLFAQHSLSLHRDHPDYREDMDDLHDRAVRMLRNALEDFANSEPWDGNEDDTPDDERGMGE